MTSPRTQPPPSDLAIERVPWSILGPDFIAQWGQPRGKLMPEHLEVLGPTGSGKSYLLVDIIKERVRRRGTAAIFVATKAADSTVDALGWPVVDTWRGVRQHEQCVFWPRTKAIGEERKKFQARKLEELLGHLWQPDANTLMIFDEFAYIENLNPELKSILQMYLREGRSHGIPVVAGKQRPQGTQRDMHSETDWKIAFQMNDRDDNERTAELFGNRREYTPVLESLSRERHEFLIQHKLTKTNYISWVDRPMSRRQAAPQPSGYRSR